MGGSGNGGCFGFGNLDQLHFPSDDFQVGCLGKKRIVPEFFTGEEFRDYPFLPQASDLEVIRGEMKLVEVTKTETSAVA